MSSVTRTDLALEVIDRDEVREGIAQIKRGEIFNITEINIDSDEHGASIGKGKGRYITMESGNLSSFTDEFPVMTKEIASELSSLLPKGRVLAVGLGNNDITPDALGPKTAFKLFATRHLTDEPEIEEQLPDLREVAVLSAGVLGQTGIETAELVKAVCDKIHPDAVIVIDALACSDISRLGTTIQISDSGISPGSGVQNKRSELSQRTLGIPVIAVGIPTVVDMHTIIEAMSGAAPKPDVPNMMVTPRDVDKIIERSSRLLAFGINLALQPSMSIEDFEGLS